MVENKEKMIKSVNKYNSELNKMSISNPLQIQTQIALRDWYITEYIKDNIIIKYTENE